ncbi:hypothetical protein CCP2SC5_1310001 [Azospirillaceae bacterium]
MDGCYIFCRNNKKVYFYAELYKKLKMEIKGMPPRNEANGLPREIFCP